MCIGNSYNSWTQAQYQLLVPLPSLAQKGFAQREAHHFLLCVRRVSSKTSTTAESCPDRSDSETHSTIRFLFICWHQNNNCQLYCSKTARHDDMITDSPHLPGTFGWPFSAATRERAMSLVTSGMASVKDWWSFLSSKCWTLMARFIPRVSQLRHSCTECSWTQLDKAGYSCPLRAQWYSMPRGDFGHASLELLPRAWVWQILAKHGHGHSHEMFLCRSLGYRRKSWCPLGCHAQPGANTFHLASRTLMKSLHKSLWVDSEQPVLESRTPREYTLVSMPFGISVCRVSAAHSLTILTDSWSQTEMVDGPVDGHDRIWLFYAILLAFKACHHTSHQVLCS